MTPDELIDMVGVGERRWTGQTRCCAAHARSSVKAADPLESNVQPIERLKVRHNFESLVSRQADLMWPFHRRGPSFDLISIERLKVGGRLYISVHQSGAFRFFINRAHQARATVERPGSGPVTGSECSPRPPLITSYPNASWPLRCRASWRT